MTDPIEMIDAIEKIQEKLPGLAENEAEREMLGYIKNHLLEDELEFWRDKLSEEQERLPSKG